MERLALLVALVVVAVGVATLLRRRAPDAPSAAREHLVPTQLDRSDFERPDVDWLVAVFTSSSCDSCAAVWSVAEVLASDQVVVQQVEVNADAELHRRYRVDAVPMTLIVGPDGVVRTSFLGPVSSTHLWAAVAEAREPGSIPPGCGEH